MKLRFEEFTPDSDSSFRLIINPRLNDVFYWHFHPEFELVYIEGATGTRHVGEHISRYEGSDLVFIGSYIPHLNFDYGVKTDCEKVVLQIRQDFLGNAFANIPELSAVYRLFEQSKHGIAFGKETKLLLSERLKNLKNLGHFEQFLEILSIFQVLAQSHEMILLHPKPVENQHNKKEQERMTRIYNFIDSNYQQKIEVEEVASMSSLSKSAFCRYFKKITRLTFVEFQIGRAHV